MTTVISPGASSKRSSRRRRRSSSSSRVRWRPLVVRLDSCASGEAQRFGLDPARVQLTTLGGCSLLESPRRGRARSRARCGCPSASSAVAGGFEVERRRRRPRRAGRLPSAGERSKKKVSAPTGPSVDRAPAAADRDRAGLAEGAARGAGGWPRSGTTSAASISSAAISALTSTGAEPGAARARAPRSGPSTSPGVSSPSQPAPRTRPAPAGRARSGRGGASITASQSGLARPGSAPVAIASPPTSARMTRSQPSSPAAAANSLGGRAPAPRGHVDQDVGSPEDAGHPRLAEADALGGRAVGVGERARTAERPAPGGRSSGRGPG